MARTKLEGTDLYVGFFSALDYWRGVSNLGDYRDVVEQQEADSEGIEHFDIIYSDRTKVSRPVFRQRDILGLGIRLSAQAPLDILVSESTALRKTNKLIPHLLAGKLPKRSFVCVRRHVYVASPELTFLELAQTLSLPQLVLVGMELTGTYALDGSKEDGTGFAQRPRLITAKRLAQYLQWVHNRDGLELARNAANLLMSNSASPRESVSVLALTMPLRLRGLGLPKPRLNHRTKVTKKNRSGTSQSQYYYDFYWSQTKVRKKDGALEKRRVDGEYDSDEHHSGSLKMYDDAQRGNSVQYLGTAHVVITSYDLQSADRLIKIARQISRCIWHRLPSKERLAILEPELNSLLEDLKNGLIYPVSLDCHGNSPLHERPTERRIRRTRKSVL